MSQPSSENSFFSSLFRAPLEGFNRFILSDLRDGRLSLDGLSFSSKVITLFGFIVLAVTIALIPFIPFIREQSYLITLRH